MVVRTKKAPVWDMFEFAVSAVRGSASVSAWCRVPGAWWGTWDGSGFWRDSDGQGPRLGLPLLVLCHHKYIVLRVPLQSAQNHILTATGQSDLWLPVGLMLLKDTQNRPRST